MFVAFDVSFNSTTLVGESSFLYLKFDGVHLSYIKYKLEQRKKIIKIDVSQRILMKVGTYLHIIIHFTISILVYSFSFYS